MMKEVLYFYQSTCPYCAQADRLLAELCAEDPRYATVKITKIEERKNAALADSYDYYYVPCLWVDGKKLHEGAADKQALRAVLEAALQ